jgi:hypothetical protein
MSYWLLGYLAGLILASGIWSAVPSLPLVALICFNVAFAAFGFLLGKAAER